jgi:hypothetical protein
VIKINGCTPLNMQNKILHTGCSDGSSFIPHQAESFLLCTAIHTISIYFDKFISSVITVQYFRIWHWVLLPRYKFASSPFCYFWWRDTKKYRSCMFVPAAMKIRELVQNLRSARERDTTWYRQSIFPCEIRHGHRVKVQQRVVMWHFSRPWPSTKS